MIKSTIALLIIVAAGVFQTTGACDENHDYMDHQASAFRNTQPRIYDPYYRYANTPFFIPYYYNYPPSSRVQESSGIILKHLLNTFAIKFKIDFHSCQTDNYEARTPSADKFNFANPFKNSNLPKSKSNFDRLSYKN
jgi:hypothetical protein